MRNLCHSRSETHVFHTCATHFSVFLIYLSYRQCPIRPFGAPSPRGEGYGAGRRYSRFAAFPTGEKDLELLPPSSGRRCLEGGGGWLSQRDERKCTIARPLVSSSRAQPRNLCSRSETHAFHTCTAHLSVSLICLSYRQCPIRPFGAPSPRGEGYGAGRRYSRFAAFPMGEKDLELLPPSSGRRCPEGGGGWLSQRDERKCTIVRPLVSSSRAQPRDLSCRQENRTYEEVRHSKSYEVRCLPLPSHFLSDRCARKISRFARNDNTGKGGTLIFRP